MNMHSGAHMMFEAMNTDRQNEVWQKLLHRGASGAFLVMVSGASLGLIVHVVVARLIGVTEYGIYTFALTWVSVLSVAALLGQNSGALRFIPIYRFESKWGELRGFRRGASLLTFTASSVILVVGALIVYMLRDRLGVKLELTLLAGFLLLPLLTQLQLNAGFFQGFKYATTSGVFNDVLRPIIYLGIIVCLGFLLQHRLTAPVVMLASGASVLVALICSELVLTHFWPAAGKHARPNYEVRTWFHLGRQLFFMAALGIVFNRVDILILGGLAGAGVVGPYYAAVQLASLALYGLNAVNTILAPMIAERYAAGDHVALVRLVRYAARLTFIITFGMALITAIAGRWILELFGSGFVVAFIPLLIILVGQCLSAAIGPVGFLMTMTSFEKQAPLFFGGAALLNLVMSILLIPLLGITGAAIATASATVVWNVSALIFVRQRLSINPTILPFVLR